MRAMCTLLMLVALLAIAACGGGEPALPPVQNPAEKAPAGDGAAAPEGAAPAAEAAAGEEYRYNPIGKRDPFRSPLADQDAANREVRTPLQRYDIDQLKLVGIIWGISNPKAMVETPDGKGFVVQKGVLVGRNWGKVTRISQQEVIISEEYRDPEGRLFVNEISLALPKEEKLQDMQ